MAGEAGIPLAKNDKYRKKKGILKRKKSENP